MSDSALSCIVCGADLANVFPNTTNNQPMDGTAFTTSGHYGSTFFDPMDGQQLEINVCDPCLTKHKDRIAWRRATRAIECESTQVGFEYLGNPLVPYTGQDEFQEPREISLDELGAAVPGTMWNAVACEEARRRHRERVGSPEQP